MTSGETAPFESSSPKVRHTALSVPRIRLLHKQQLEIERKSRTLSMIFRLLVSGQEDSSDQ